MKVTTNTLKLGSHWSFNLRNDPKRLAFVLSRYKFAATMIHPSASVLELGCSEGIGASLLAESASTYTGVDMDQDAISTAYNNWGTERTRFINDDFMGKSYGSFESVVSLDVVEHIQIESEDLYFETVAANLGTYGRAVIGTPNIIANRYASAASRAGHVNLFDAERLENKMSAYFHTVLMFGANDEVVHTSYLAMAHYVIAVGIGTKSK